MLWRVGGLRGARVLVISCGRLLVFVFMRVAACVCGSVGASVGVWECVCVCDLVCVGVSSHRCR